MSDVTRGDEGGQQAADGPLTVAVTGGIGAGKSTVSSALAGRGAVVIDADRLAREVVQPGTPGLAAVVTEFGRGVLATDGGLDRPALARIVFADDDARARLERITHPLIRELFARRLAAAPADAVVVNDIPLIRKLSDAARYHLVVSVGVADDEVRVRRLVDRGHTDADARARITAQIPDAQRRALSDVWIDNSGTTAELAEVVERLWRRLTAFATNRRAGRPASPTVADRDPRRRAELTDLLAERMSLACGGAPVAVTHPGAGAEGSGPIELTVTAPDTAAAEAMASALADAGFPPAAAEMLGADRRFSSADPGQTVNLYLTVRGGQGRRRRRRPAR